jgi:MYXO-CTERM domain-containing protein
VWGPPPDSVEASPGPVAATGLAFVARSANLAGFLAGDTPMRELLATATLPPGPAPAKTYAGGFANVVPLSPTAPEPKPEPEPEPGVTLGPASAEPEPSASGCSRCSVEPTGDPYSALAMGLTLGLVLRRRQRGAP